MGRRKKKRKKKNIKNLKNFTFLCFLCVGVFTFDKERRIFLYLFFFISVHSGLVNSNIFIFGSMQTTGSTLDGKKEPHQQQRGTQIKIGLNSSSAFKTLPEFGVLKIISYA